MAISDKLATFGLAEALNTGAAGDYILGDAIDIVTARDIGAGRPLYLVLSVSTACTSGGSATAAFSLITGAADPTVTSDDVLMLTAPIAVADMTLGATLAVIAIPMEGAVPYERYLGLMQTTATAAFTAGAINAYLTLDPPKWQAYPEGQN